MLGAFAAGVERDIDSIAATDALLALALLLLLAVPSARAAARRFPQRSAMEWFAGFATAALIIAVTLLRGEVGASFRIFRLADWSWDDVTNLSRDPLGSSQFLLNVALFVPAGAVWTWLTRRPGRTFVALVAGSFVIEGLQAVSGTGANDLADVAANSIGALIGTAIAVVARRLGPDRGRTVAPRRRVQLLVGAALAVVLVTVGWFAGASRRQSQVRSIVEDRFADTDLREVRAMIDQDFEALLNLVDGVRADGVSTDDRVALRYPATFFSLQRCVYVIWTESTVDIRDASGDECTRLIDDVAD